MNAIVNPTEGVLVTIRQQLGKRLCELRKLRNFTQTDLAKCLGVCRNTIVNWENGIKCCGCDDLYKLANVLSVEPSDLLPEIEK